MNDQLTERVTRSSLVLCLCYAVAACGGGSDTGSADGAAALPTPVATSTVDTAPDVALDRSRRTPKPKPAPVPAPAPAPAPVPVPVPVPVPAPAPVPVPGTTAINASCGLNGSGGIAAEVLQRVNAFRAAGAVCGSTTYAPAPPLIWNSMLTTAASGHSSDMADNNYFSHTSLDGRTFAQRITATGYRYTAAGENIAAGQTSVQSVMTGWINSPGHCQNLMNPTYRDIGMACVRNDAATYRLYWTMDLGRS